MNAIRPCSAPSTPYRCPEHDCLSTKVRYYGYSKPIACLKDQKRRRLQCASCKKTWSENFYKLHYRLKHPDPAINSKIFELLLSGLSYRKIARVFNISEHSVRIRVNRLSQQALSFQNEMIKEFSIREEIVFDGLENFSGTQYDPNNIQQALGRDSLFIYDFNFAAMNRKGRMSEWQRLRLAEIVLTLGRYDHKAIKVATKELLERLLTRAPQLVLLSDEHFHYRHAIAEMKDKHRIEHVTISSKACRNFQNILFAVNHADLLIRKGVGAFARETISFSKTAGRMCQKFALFMIYKNFLCPQFTKSQVTRPEAHVKTPAQTLGICQMRLTFTEIFGLRSLTDEGLNSDWKCFWNGKVPPQYLRSKITA